MNDTKQLSSGDDLAKQALAEAQTKQLPPTTGASEAEQSDQFAETLSALEAVIERNAKQLEELSGELKERRQMIKDYFDNDTQLQELNDQAQQAMVQVKELKAKVTNQPQVIDLRLKIQELNDRKKELEETLSNHLVNHYQMTNSTSFDTSDGDQWEYTIKAKVKSRLKTG